MKMTFTMTFTKRKRPPKSWLGFSMLEMLVAMAVFLIIAGAAIKLFRAHVPLVSSQQNQTGINLALRAAAIQLQTDLVTAGTGFDAVDMPPIGMTITNNTAPGCFNAATLTYGPSCFDTLNILQVDTSTPPSNPSGNATTCVSTTASIIFVVPPAGSPVTLPQLASDFHTGDQIILVKTDGTMATTILSKDGLVSGGKVQLQHNPTAAGGASGDPLGISMMPNNKLGDTFCTNDWVLKLAPPITYWVDTGVPADPKLVRRQSGIDNVVAEQIIGFRVGAALINGGVDTPYNYNAQGAVTSGGYANDWTSIRSVRISLIGRGTTVSDVTNTYRNNFDGGPYKVEAVSVVVNPRNLSMNNN